MIARTKQEMRVTQCIDMHSVTESAIKAIKRRQNRRDNNGAIEATNTFEHK